MAAAGGDSPRAGLMRGRLRRLDGRFAQACPPCHRAGSFWGGLGELYDFPVLGGAGLCSAHYLRDFFLRNLPAPMKFSSPARYGHAPHMDDLGGFAKTVLRFLCGLDPESARGSG